MLSLRRKKQLLPVCTACSHTLSEEAATTLPGGRRQGKCSVIDPPFPHTHFIKEAVKLQTHQRPVQGQELELQQGILS